jgi:predicted transcriptional regulator
MVAGRKPSSGLTDAEHRIMTVLWAHPRSTVGEVVERMDGPDRPAYNSVLTIMRILERKGYVAHEKHGRAFTYAPVVDHGQARRGALRQVLSRFFNGSRELLVMDLLGHEQMTGEQLRKVRELLESAVTVDDDHLATSKRRPAPKGRS